MGLARCLGRPGAARGRNSRNLTVSPRFQASR